jgi:hypothetical protein
MGYNFDCMYDGILGKDFWESKATINYCDRTINMGKVMLKVDHNSDQEVNNSYKLTV